MNKLNILAISGSLKSSSANSRIIRTLSGFANGETNFIIYSGLDQLPHFNPDKEAGNEEVARFRQGLKEADGVIISTPEYAFGVPGTLKNALDWTVSSGELNEKPVVAISASPMYEGGSKAMASLLLTLSALGTKMTKESHLSIPNVLNKMNKEGEIVDSTTLSDLKTIFEHLIIKIKQAEST